MQVYLGDKLFGVDGELGQVKHIILDSKSGRAEQMTVKHLLGAERLVSLFVVTETEEGKAYLQIDRSAFDKLESFNEQAYRAPGLTVDSTDKWQNDLSMRAPNLNAAYGPLESVVDAVPPEGNPVTPMDERQPAISLDTFIFDKEGKKIGRVGRFGVDCKTGEAVRLELHEGTVLGRNIEIPLDLVSAYGPDGIVLQATRDQVR